VIKIVRGEVCTVKLVCEWPLWRPECYDRIRQITLKVTFFNRKFTAEGQRQSGCIGQVAMMGGWTVFMSTDVCTCTCTCLSVVYHVCECICFVCVSCVLTECYRWWIFCFFSSTTVDIGNQITST
jgi:hypothetical protein